MIASAIVKVEPGTESTVALALETVKGVEVVGQNAGSVVIVLEADSSSGLEETSSGIEKMQSVLGVFPVYVNSEDLSDTEGDEDECSENLN